MDSGLRAPPPIPAATEIASKLQQFINSKPTNNDDEKDDGSNKSVEMKKGN